MPATALGGRLPLHTHTQSYNDTERRRTRPHLLSSESKTLRILITESEIKENKKLLAFYWIYLIPWGLRDS